MISVVFYILAGLLVICGAVCIVAWVLYVPRIMKVFGEGPWLCASRLRPVEDVEECQFTTADGLVLRGSYLPTTAPVHRGTILFCHELHGDRWGALHYAKDLIAQGFDVFTFDFRNHGTSDSVSGYRPMPWLTQYELADVRAAVDYLCSRADGGSTPIGLMGISRGANAALCAAAGDPRVKAVVTEAAFPLGQMQRHYIRRFMGIYIPIPWLAESLPDVCLLSFCAWAKFFVEQRCRCRIVNVEQVVGHVHQAVFMIHGEQDAYVPMELARTLRARLAGRSKLWAVPCAKHNGAIEVAAEQYGRRVARFFRRHLNGRRATRTVGAYRSSSKCETSP